MFDTRLYLELKNTWPQSGRHIIANYDENTIVVYQAYNPKIAQAIVKNKKLDTDECKAAGYSLTRMTWIKTNFLWMMYRAGWAMKAGQERILAFKIRLDDFEDILRNSVRTSHSNKQSEEWKQSIKSAKVVLQWDPDHAPNGDKIIERRAIQLGLRDECLIQFSNSTVDVIDITDFVHEQFKNCMKDQKPFSDLLTLRIPFERVFLPKNLDIAKHIDLSI